MTLRACIVSLLLPAALTGCGGAAGVAPLPTSFSATAVSGGGASKVAASGAVAAPAINDSSQVSETTAFAVAARDLATDSDPADVRYFSLAYLQTSGLSAAELASVRLAITKLMNSLSWSKHLAAVPTIDTAHAVMKIHLSDFGWRSATWEALAAGHPAASTSTPDLGTLQDATGSAKPMLRAEWVVRNASAPPLYYQLLGLPDTESALETTLGVNLGNDIVQGTAERAGFSNSLVSANDRVIEHHATPSGFLWRSYEFSDRSGSHDIFNFPLGPGGSDQSASGAITSAFGNAVGDAGTSAAPPPLSQFAQYAFASSGGEFLFTLPNSMLAFYISDGSGIRLNSVPGAVKPIIPGASCFNCHALGTQAATDQVRATTMQNNTLPAAALAEVQKLYVQPAVLTELLQQNAATYQSALGELGLPSGDADPINAVLSLNIQD